MLIFVIKIVILGIFLYLENLFAYKHIRKIDKKERNSLNTWETKHIEELIQKNKVLKKDNK